MEIEIKQLREELAEQRATIDKLRTKLVEQEHRLFPILKNFFIARKKWPKDDPRRAAAWKALITFFSPGVAAAAAGIVGLATVVMLGYQNWLFRQSVEQGQLQLAQTQLQLEQTRAQYQQSRRTDLIAFLYETERTEGNKTVPKAAARIRSEAIREFISLEDSEQVGDRMPPGSFRGGETAIDLSGALLQGVRLVKADLNSIDFQSATFEGARLALVDFSKANLNRADLSGLNLWLADFTYANLNETNFTGTVLTDANLTNTSLYHAILTDAILSRTDLRKAINLTCDQLQTAKSWSEAYRDENLACGEPIPEKPDESE